jgi:hypothetical protein
VASGLWARPELVVVRYIQFPWRLLGLASLAAAVAGGLAFERVVSRGRWQRAVAPALGVVLLVLVGWPSAQAKPLAAATIARDPESIRGAVVSTTGVDEYLPRSVAAAPGAPRAELVRQVERAALISDRSDGEEHSLQAEATGPAAVLGLALHDFPGWRLHTVAGPALAALAARDGLLEVRLPAAGRYQLRLAFEATPLVRAAQLISLLALLLILPGAWALARPARVPA